uniref:non-specific serine/threonine protein kinase n=1 Tax=Denticeps clupeoides TaxID=299321 RepID=A0AAY4EFS2_9TELE
QSLVTSQLDYCNSPIRPLQLIQNAEVDRFRRLIRQEETVKELDYSSGNKNCKQSKQLTWDAVFRFLQKFLQKETEALQSGKTTVSAITKANRQKKKQEISSLVKYFIRCANKRGPKLKCAELLSHIVDVLENPFNCSAYGEDYSSILLKDVLSIRKYWCDINQQQWHLLLNLYCGLFSGSSVSVNRVLISRIIHTLVQGCCLQTDGLTDKLFSFFSKALSNARSEKQHAVLEHLVSSLNVFLSSVAMNCRRRACSLGEELLPSLLHVWNQMRPSPVLKEEMVDLFNLQLRLHHPEGAKTMETGQSTKTPHTLLYGLYDTLVTEISQIGSRGKYATGSRQIAVKENLIELTASICNQLFSQESRILEVSQAPYRGSVLDSPSSSSSKRRRVEIGWEVLREHLQLHQSDFDMIPWLQITAVLLSRYPSILPVQELVPLLSLLCQLLGEQQHRGERGPYVLRCLREVARCQALHPKLAEPELGRLWSRACALALRGVSSPQLEIPSMELLCCMTQGALVPVDRELWKLFSGSACKPSWPSLCCSKGSHILLHFLHDLLRECLIFFINFINMVLHTFLCRDFPQNLVSRIIVSLTLKDSRAGMVFLMGSLDLNRESFMSSYRMFFFYNSDFYFSSLQSPATPPECLIRCVCLLTGVLAGFVCAGIISEDDACYSGLFQKAKVHSTKCELFTCGKNLIDLIGRELINFLTVCWQYLTLLKNLPAEDTLLSSEDFDAILRPLPDVCSLYRQDQAVCAAMLKDLLPAIQNLGRVDSVSGEESDMNILSRTGKSTACVRAALVHCLVALLEVDPCCKWAVLHLRDEELLVCNVLPDSLADPHHHVRMLTALAVERQVVKDVYGLEKKCMLPLKHQQTSFENIYLKAQEGMKRGNPSDETFNRQATLLKSLSMVMCCSPVCEKQALFALFQSYKENGIEEHLLKKVLCSVSCALGYRSSQAFISSHLYYLVAEWLYQREKDRNYTLDSFPYTLLSHSTLEDFYRASYQVLLPHLVFLNDFEQVRSIATCLSSDWRVLLADCFPKIVVNILPYFAPSGQDVQVSQQKEKAHKVYNLLKDSNCLGKQQIDSLICSNLAEIVVELLMTLYEGGGGVEQRGDLNMFVGELDPAPNPPFFSSYVIQATLDYISKCHSANKSLVTILSKTPISIQKILLAVCQKGAETTNAYERHRILMMYHLFVGLLLREVKDGLGGAWAFVLRDVIYTLIHYINTNSTAQLDEVSTRSLSLCCDLLTRVCHTAVQFCGDALECHLQVIVGTLTAQVTDQPSISKQVLGLLRFLVVENAENNHLREAIYKLEPFPDLPAFSELRAVQQQLKSNSGAFTLKKKIVHFLSVTSCDSLPRTRLEGMKDLQRLLCLHYKCLVCVSLADPAASVLVKVVLNLLQLCKLAQHHPGGEDILEAAGSCLGELGPVDLSTIALHHSKDEVYENAADLFPDPESRWIFIILTCMNNALTHHRYVRQAAAQCVKDVLSSPSGSVFWDRYKSERDPMLVYLSPFRSAKKKARCSAESPFLLWLPTPGRHRDWLRGLCIALLDSGGVRTEALLLTRGLCQVKTDFCQRILPLFIHDVLLGDRGGLWRDLLSRHIQSFFTHCTRPVSSQSSRPTTPLLPDSDSEVGCQGQVDKASLRTMLAVIDYLRQQRRHSTGTVCDSNFWLELNYLEVSRGAQLCSAHFTALLYCEIYLDKLRSDLEESHRRIIFDESSQTLSINSVSEKSMEDTGISLQELLIEVYRSIGEPDSLYGCGGGKITSALTRIRTYEHEEIWGKALTSYDLHSNLPELTRLVGIVEGLQHFGLNSILSTYLQGLQSEGVEWGTELRELRFQAAWRSSQWDCTLMEKLNPGFNESVFNALQALRDKDFTTFDQILKNGRVFEMEELCRGSLEAVSSLYPALCNLQRLSELESIRPLFSRCSNTGLGEVYSQWLQHLELLHDSEFSLVEPILALRSAMLDTLVSCEPNLDCKSILRSTHVYYLLIFFVLCQLAERAVFQVKQHSTASVGLVTTTSWQLEEVQVFWVKKEQELALGLLKQMTESLEDQVSVACNPALVPAYAECLRLCGSWLAETCLESPAVILEMYLERAVEVIKGQSSKLHPDPKLQSQKTQAFLSLARFSDAQYKSIENYMRSSEFENKQALLKKAKEEVDLMKERNVTTNRYTVKVMRELELDVQALENLQTDRKRFLLKAVENYIRCLELGDEHDTWVFRLASLWLENSDKKSVNDAMGDGVKKIPSFKFLPLMYQLAARMGTKVSTSAGFEDVGFHDVLNELICRTCLDHPHHTLFIILALVNANKDESFSRSRLSKGSTQQQSSLDRERSEVAKEIVNEIRKKRAKMVRGIEILCDAYITLAYMDVSRYKNEKKAIPIPQEQPIMSIKDLDDVIIPTMEIKVDSSGKYENLVTVRAFKPHFYLVGGVNLPKIIDCVGSDGKSRRQLVKGQDDLRQDAVMQQVFHMCSTLLQRNAETRKRKLNIRRYKVVPFSQRSGVLEWCSGTVPIGEFLVDPQNGAHKRFRPQDWTNMDCRKKMMQTQRLSFRDKILAFTEVCKNFRPVFRYFCMERFLDPAVWLERRLAYTRSVATSSIVGYIVGLGDRHIQNILIDEQTAELVHIDLGVAFEQGKILPTPETVPFRLSRDIVDGMGITGVEGVFRRCCEKTMEVMRSSQEALLTIVEVLLYDPLFDWTMNPLKAFYLQQQLDEQAELNATLNPTPGDILEAHRKSSIDSQNFNKVAERVLLRLQEKLKGVEGGSVLSVGGQVNLLIQQAMDPKNLSRLFPGWQAWV